MFRQVSLHARLVGAYVTGEWSVVLQTATNMNYKLRFTKTEKMMESWVLLEETFKFRIFGKNWEKCVSIYVVKWQEFSGREKITI